MRARRLIRVVLLSAFTGGCSGTSSSSSLPSVSYGAQRITNNTFVSIGSISRSSVTFVPGAYSFNYDKVPTTPSSVITQASDSGAFVSVSSAVFAAQSFTTAGEAFLDQVSLHLNRVSGETMVVKLYSGGIPGVGSSSTLLDTSSQTFAANGLATVNFLFASSSHLDSATTYYLTAELTTAGAVDFYADSTGDTYVGGTGYQKASGSPTYTDLTYDFRFGVTLSSVGFRYKYNGVSSSIYSSYPASSELALDGGAAGLIKFTPQSPGPTTLSETDVVAAVRTY